MTAAIPESESYGAVASGRSSPTFPSLPIDIVRLVFEVSVTPSLRAGDEQQRQRTAYALCLVSKNVKDWVEPLLYEKVVLESREQVIGFLRALEIKPTTFLARAVKTVWLLHKFVFHDVNNVVHDAFNQLPLMLSKLPLLERLTFFDGWDSMLVLSNISKSQSGPYMLQELTIIEASSNTARSLDLRHLTIQKLHFINCSKTFFEFLLERANGDKVILDTLRAIPQVYLDFISIPGIAFTSYLKSIVIPLWILPSPELISVLHIRASSTTPAQRYGSPADDENVDLDPQDSAGYFDEADSWVKYFNLDVQRYGARLVVYTRLEADVDSQVNSKTSYIDQCKAWIGLD